MIIDNSDIVMSKSDIKKGLILPKKVTENLSYICGFLCGDGFISANNDTKDFYIKCVGNIKNEKEFYNKIICLLFKSVFNLHVNAKSHDKGTTFGVTIYSKSLVRYFIEKIGLPFDKKSDKIEILPIFMKDEKLLLSFIRGFVDADFCLTLKKRYKKMKYYPCIEGSSRSSKIMNQIYDFLVSHNFNPVKYDTNYYDARINKKVKMYRLDINGHYQTVMWMNKIGFKNFKQLIRFELWKERNKNNKRARNALIARERFELSTFTQTV